MSVYVVLAHSNYVNAFNVPYPVGVFAKRKDAYAYAERKNAKASRLTYYVRSAKQEPTP